MTEIRRCNKNQCFSTNCLCDHKFLKLNLNLSFFVIIYLLLYDNLLQIKKNLEQIFEALRVTKFKNHWTRPFNVIDCFLICFIEHKSMFHSTNRLSLLTDKPELSWESNKKNVASWYDRMLATTTSKRVRLAKTLQIKMKFPVKCNFGLISLPSPSELLFFRFPFNNSILISRRCFSSRKVLHE